MKMMHLFLVALFAGVWLDDGIRAATRIQWLDWTPAAFEQAKQTDKLIMVNVGHEGCTACRFMETHTFSDAAVIELVNTHFVAIQVDSEARPDIGERYSDWAWPATAFMLPDGTQITALRGSLRPPKFRAILRGLLEDRAHDRLAADPRAPYGAPTTPTVDPIDQLREQVRAQLDDSFDDERGGWGSAKVLDHAEPTLQFLLRAHLYDDDMSRVRGLKTIEGYGKQTDPVWGGMFYASFNRWDNVVGEKRLESQAAALQLFADGYQITGLTMFRDALDNIDRYLTQVMQSEAGLFYASQKAMVPGLPGNMDMDAYYALDDAGRRRYGTPATDHATYSDLNARIIYGYVRAFEATGQTAFLATARRAATTLIKERQTSEGWILQYSPHRDLERDRRVHVLDANQTPYLRPQAYTGLALLYLYQATLDPVWLEHATRVAAAMRGALEDETLGGFFGAPADGTETIIARRKPLEDNAVAARFCYLLGVLIKDRDLKAVGERTIRAVAAPAIVRREGRVTGNLAVALELLTAGYVEFSVVGSSDDPAAAALLAAARAVYEPRKIVHYEKAGRYPAKDRPAMYICNDDACSLPIFEPADVRAEAAKFIPTVFRHLVQTTR
jgi:uncharacterized protein YyaL (SSP411 family)